MTLARSNWLLLLCPLLLACADSDAKSDSLSASGGVSNITSASETSPNPPTSTGASEGSTAPDSTSDDSASGGGDTSSEPTTGVTGTSGDTSGATGTSGETGSHTSTGAIEEPEPCQIEATKITPVPPDVLFVLDKSGSMTYEKWDHDDNPQTGTVTRWHSLHGVVKSVVTTFDKTVNFGVKLYPKMDATPWVDQGACDVDPGVEVEIAPMNAVNVLAGTPAADFEVLGGTPIESGLKEAYTYLKSLPPGNQRFALLIADGEISKTCMGETILEAIGLVVGAEKAGIPTYVVGIDVDPSITEQLAALAEAGGRPNPNGPDPFYQVTNQIELQAAIQQIVDDTLSCVIDVDPEPSEPALFEVWIGKDKVPAAASCAKDDGWVWTKPHSQIQLCGAACLQLKKSGLVEARYYCEAG